ncbi:MAG: hypothetical protein ACYCX2_11920 [Christensenellales bacterium]
MDDFFAKTDAEGQGDVAAQEDEESAIQDVDGEEDVGYSMRKVCLLFLFPEKPCYGKMKKTEEQVG